MLIGILRAARTRMINILTDLAAHLTQGGLLALINAY